MFLKKMKSFLCETIKLTVNRPQAVNMPDLIRYFPSWWSSLGPQKNPLADNKPWIAFAAIEFLEKILHREMLVYEYGSGGSTLFFAQRVKEVISTEHDRAWYDQVVNKINTTDITNCKVRLFEPTVKGHIETANISDPNGYASDDERYRGMSFKEYASSIDEFPDEYFDIILIDGRARPSCFKHSEKKLKKGGYLILDNAERSYYHFIHNTLKGKGWRKYDYYGLFPYQSHFSETCIWQK
jgi:hypothetical protein